MTLDNLAWIQLVCAWWLSWLCIDVTAPNWYTLTHKIGTICIRPIAGWGRGEKWEEKSGQGKGRVDVVDGGRSNVAPPESGTGKRCQWVLPRTQLTHCREIYSRHQPKLRRHWRRVWLSDARAFFDVISAKSFAAYLVWVWVWGRGGGGGGKSNGYREKREWNEWCLAAYLQQLSFNHRPTNTLFYCASNLICHGFLFYCNNNNYSTRL